ncbi:calcium/sodium antiporter [Candidatus Uhrbacteria bacterium]|jgi:cation:H+ antiporter|nr:calcium/sodium antiporter [Candidatus Uhrbacteria bacterium]
MFTSILFILAGFALLIKGADYLVDGASNIAKRFGVSTLIIGLTIVAFGTSAPELVVNILSATSGSAEMALANINGSSIANILLILGIAALFGNIPVKSRTVIKEIPFMFLAGVTLVVLLSDSLLDGVSETAISRSDGVVLLLFFVIFLYYLFLSAKEAAGPAKEERAKMSLKKAIGLTAMGMAGLVLGGKLAVDGATGIAIAIGISETLVGLTIVALGTSLPELVSSVIAVRKGEPDLAVGGVVGSNIFNILMVLGVTSTITPIVVTQASIIDSVVALAAIALFFILIFTRLGKGTGSRGIDKYEGILLLTIYGSYITYTIFRG